VTIADLPHLNAGLNGLSALLLLSGYTCMRLGRLRAHRNLMVAAVVTSTFFLVSYVTYHFYAESLTRFAGPGWLRPMYLGILLTHTVLAMAVVPMVLLTLYRAARGQFDRHRRIARWTWPIWMYVSVTGVVIYLVLYQIFPKGA
jgi:uncharacterized membrane protein YozB (DUF420 family)